MSDTVSRETCPTSAPFFGFMGVTAALCFASEDSVCFYTWLFMVLILSNFLHYQILELHMARQNLVLELHQWV